MTPMTCDLFDPMVPDAIDIPADHWRWRVACLPIDEWLRWRRRSGEIQAGLDTIPTAEDIRIADRLAYMYRERS